MKNLFLIFVVTLSAICNTTAQTAQNNQPAPADTWKSIDEPSYYIQYPDSWDLDRSGTMGMTFMILSKQTSPQDQFRENINLLVQDLAGQNIDLDKFAELSQSQIKTMLTNSTFLENKKITEQTIPFQHIIYAGEINQLQLKFEQYYWVHQGKAHILTLTCETNQFDSYRETGEKIMNSFRLK